MMLVLYALLLLWDKSFPPTSFMVVEYCTHYATYTAVPPYCVHDDSGTRKKFWEEPQFNLQYWYVLYCTVLCVPVLTDRVAAQTYYDLRHELTYVRATRERAKVTSAIGR